LPGKLLLRVRIGQGPGHLRLAPREHTTILRRRENVIVLKPVLLTAGPMRPDSDRYAFEVKWDGFRALVQTSPQSVTIISRNGHDMTSRYPELQAFSSVVREPVLLDGEIICLDERGNPDFPALWFRSRSQTTPPVCFMAFDILEKDGELLIEKSYRERRRLLEELELFNPHWCAPEIHVGDGQALFDATKEMGLEGVVAKRLDSKYRPGIRSKAWTKTKHFQTRNFALLGWVPPQEWRGDRACVVLGLRSSEGVAMAGVVESGYGREIVNQLPALTRKHLRAL
jgi:bifunctional non-homologous end joining protein LigD